MRLDHDPAGQWFVATLTIIEDRHLMRYRADAWGVGQEIKDFLDQFLIGPHEIDAFEGGVAVYFFDQLDMLHFKIRFYEGIPVS